MKTLQSDSRTVTTIFNLGAPPKGQWIEHVAEPGPAPTPRKEYIALSRFG
jgi:hypothetical protein